MMRAVRFATDLGFRIEEETFAAIKENAKLIDLIAKERVRDELIKTVDSKNAYAGILLLKDCGLLPLILPELAAGIGVGQNKHHIYTVFEHNALSLKWGAEHDYSFPVKLAALLHDVGKPQTKRGEGPDSTFYGHEIVGGKITKNILRRLCFPEKLVQQVSALVKYHLFYYNVGEVTERSVRRLVANIGPENMADLVKVRICDRMGSGVPKPEPYRLRHFQYMVEKVQKDPLSPKMLKVNGDDIMKILAIAPGPKVGQILAILLDEVLDEPKRNKKVYLKNRVTELAKLAEQELERLSQKSKEKKQEFEQAVDEKVKEKYWVR
jgi:poly(A) polymerase/tRNA nucleotidyltransferase (CCA-adding enzyme)